MTDHRREISASCAARGFRDPTLFGSILRDTVTDTSDVDICVTDTRSETGGNRIARLAGLHADLTQLLGLGRDLDVVEVGLLLPDVAVAIEREGRPL